MRRFTAVQLLRPVEEMAEDVRDAVLQRAAADDGRVAVFMAGDVHMARHAVGGDAELGSPLRWDAAGERAAILALRSRGVPQEVQSFRLYTVTRPGGAPRPHHCLALQFPALLT